MWGEFVVSFRPCSEGFSPGSPVFLPPQKPTFLNSNSTGKQWMKSHSLDMLLQIPIDCLIDCFICYLYIYLFIYLSHPLK